MTSKEIIEEAIKIQESNLTMVCKENIPFCEQRINNYKQVLKDLEILEILKKIIENNIFEVGMLDSRPNGKTWLSCEDYGITLKTEDYHKIRRWLNEREP